MKSPNLSWKTLVPCRAAPHSVQNVCLPSSTNNPHLWHSSLSLVEARCVWWSWLSSLTNSAGIESAPSPVFARTVLAGALLLSVIIHAGPRPKLGIDSPPKRCRIPGLEQRNSIGAQTMLIRTLGPREKLKKSF